MEKREMEIRIRIKERGNEGKWNREKRKWRKKERINAEEELDL